MISIHSTTITNRLIYVTDFIFKELLGVPHKLTSNENELTGVVSNYGSRSLDLPSYQITPSGLLFEKSISEVITTMEGEKTKVLSY